MLILLSGIDSVKRVGRRYRLPSRKKLGREIPFSYEPIIEIIIMSIIIF
jgi:hypothetical protein